MDEQLKALKVSLSILINRFPENIITIDIIERNYMLVTTWS